MARKSVHGEAMKGRESVEYRTWCGMKQRCADQNHGAFPYYGGRGIRVCERWRASFADFLADVGRRPGLGLSLDRIDNSGDYEPGNVRWATHAEQMLNRSNNRRLEHDGRSLTIAEWSRETGLSEQTIAARTERGWPAERALTEGLIKSGPMGAAVLNAAKTRCPHGHEYTTANTYTNRHGQRICRACNRDRARRRRVAQEQHP